MRTGRSHRVWWVASIGLVLALCAILDYFLFWAHSAPDRNVFGNPDIEDLKAQCVLSAVGATIRLYRGNGGATTAFSYSVTYQSVSRPERQFFYSYARPGIDQIDCNDTGVTLISTDDNPRTITASQITSSLIKQPIGYYDGKLRDQPSPIPGWAWPAALAVLMFATSGAMFFSGRRLVHPQS